MSKSSIVSIFALLAFSTLGAVGCSAESEGAEGDGSESDLRARATCTAASYNAALVHYKAAVTAAKLHSSDRACDADDATEYGITEHVARAVSTCGAFKDVVATSPWAAPVRKALGDNLAYYTLTGKIGEQWAGLEAALGAGVKLYGPAPGIYGNMSTLSFGAEGKAVMTRLVWNDELGYPTAVDSPATYRVGRVLSADAVELEITTGGKPVTVRLERLGSDDAHAPSFHLMLEGEEFLSFPSECDA